MKQRQNTKQKVSESDMPRYVNDFFFHRNKLICFNDLLYNIYNYIPIYLVFCV